MSKEKRNGGAGLLSPNPGGSPLLLSLSWVCPPLQSRFASYLMKSTFTISSLYALGEVFSLGGRGVYSSIHGGSGELELLLKHLLDREGPPCLSQSRSIPYCCVLSSCSVLDTILEADDIVKLAAPQDARQGPDLGVKWEGRACIERRSLCEPQ